MNGERLLVRLYRASLVLYPRSFREKFGRDMVELASDSCRDERTWRVAGRLIVDLAISLPHQHMEVSMKRNVTSVVPVVYAALAAVGVLVVMAGGVGGLSGPVGLAIVVCAGCLAGVATRRAMWAAEPVGTDAWWKLIVAGVGIIAGVVVAAGLGVNAWFAGMLAVVGSVVLVMLGLILGVIRTVAGRSANSR